MALHLILYFFNILYYLYDSITTLLHRIAQIVTLDATKKIVYAPAYLSQHSDAVANKLDSIIYGRIFSATLYCVSFPFYI